MMDSYQPGPSTWGKGIIHTGYLLHVGSPRLWQVMIVPQMK